MTTNRNRNTLFWALIALLLAIGFLALADPGISRAATVRQTVDRWGPRIAQDEHAVRALLVSYPTGHVRLARVLRREARDLLALRRRVSAERGRAKADVIDGLAMIATAYNALSRDVLAAHGGPVPRREVRAAVKTVKRGRALLARGIAYAAAHAAAWRLS